MNLYTFMTWVKDNTLMNVATMTTAELYRLLVEKEITMTEPSENFKSK